MARSGSDPEFTVYYDGQCPMCTALIGRVRRSAKGREFAMCDMHSAAEMPFDKPAVAREIHAVDRGGRVYRGAEAILTIIGRYPHWSLAAAIGGSPLLRPLLPLGYAVIAANRRFLFGAASRIFWLKATVLVAFCLGLAISSPLWIGPRAYPLTPVWDGLPALAHPLDQLLFGAIFALAVAALLSSRPQKFIALLLAIVGVFCLGDQTRWQPWVFLYGAVLAMLAAFSWDAADDAGRRLTLNTLRLIIVATYLFSGLQKLNWNFIASEFPGMAAPITDHFPSLAGVVHFGAMAAPIVQIGFAVGLLTKRFRRVSLITAVAMHLFILAMLGPFGQNWNVVVWPWTAAMAVIDILLFAASEPLSWREILPAYPAWPQALALLLFVALPLLSFVDLWDSYLSAALYSGNLTEATVYLSDVGARNLPDPVRRLLVRTAANTNVLNLQRWAIEDLNAMPYPEGRVYKGIARNLCRQLPHTVALVLIVREQRLLFSKPETGYRCDQL